MVNTKFKFIASQAKAINIYIYIYIYINTRSKLLKCNASIYFNEQYLAKKVIPKYANLKFANNPPVAQVAQTVHQVQNKNVSSTDKETILLSFMNTPGW